MLSYCPNCGKQINVSGFRNVPFCSTDCSLDYHNKREEEMEQFTGLKPGDILENVHNHVKIRIDSLMGELTAISYIGGGSCIFHTDYIINNHKKVTE